MAHMERTVMIWSDGAFFYKKLFGHIPKISKFES